MYGQFEPRRYREVTVTDPEPFDRSFFVPRVFMQLGGGMFVPPDADDILPLGNSYRSAMRKIYAKRNVIFSKIARHLADMSDDELQLSFFADGSASSGESKAWMSTCRQHIKMAFDRLSPWYVAPLFRTKTWLISTTGKGRLFLILMRLFGYPNRTHRLSVLPTIPNLSARLSRIINPTTILHTKYSISF